MSENKFKVIVKTNASKSEIISFNDNTYKINLHAKPLEGEANKELIRFLSKKLKKQVRIISGFRSKEKIIEIINQVN